MNIKLNVKYILACCLFPFATVAWAGDDSMKRLDSNSDGVISKEEAVDNKKLVINWDTIDSNKDGQIDRAEFSAFEMEDTPDSD